MTDSYGDIDALQDFSGTSAELTSRILAMVRVTGASVSTMGFLPLETVAASDREAARLDEAQFDLGEGPCWDAVSSGEPVLEPDLRNGPRHNWPALVESLRDERIGAVFAFPMSVGSVRMGAIDLYHAEPQELAETDVRRAAAVAEALSRYVLRRALARAGEVEPAQGTSAFSRRIVHQATGYVIAQLGVSAEEAELLLQGHAFAAGLSMREVAQAILDGGQPFTRVDDTIEDER
jgi:hypothetical protein